MDAASATTSRAALAKTQVKSREVAGILKELATDRKHGRVVSDLDRLTWLRRLVSHGGIPTLEPFLPLLLNLKGQPYTLVDHFPFSPIFRVVGMPSSITYKTGRQVSKTGRADSKYNRVYDEYGRRYRLDSVEPGQTVQSFDTATFRTCRKQVLFRHENPVKACYYIRTRRGVEMELAGTHPLRTYAGWTSVDELDVGDRIVHARRGGRFGRKKVDDRRIRITAYMLGDGSFRGNYNFTAARHTQAIAEMRVLLRDYREYRKARTQANALVVNRDHVLYDWAVEDGLCDKLAHEKQIPEWVFLLSRADTRTFIERLWATAGMVKPGNRKVTISYTSTSRELVYDLKSLLAKFGIPASVKEHTGAYKKPDGQKVECRRYWSLRVETREGWQTFLAEFSVPDKPEVELPVAASNNNRYTVPIEIAGLIADIAGECRGANRYDQTTETLLSHGLRKTPKYPISTEKMQRYLAFFRKHRPEHPLLDEFAKHVDRDADWDEIVEIRNVGEHKCVDIEVEEHHNYLLDGIVSHNSTSVAAHGVVLANAIVNPNNGKAGNFTTLYVMPLYEQVRRFSTMYVRPFIDRSPVKSLWTSTATENSVLQRTFLNDSRMVFSFALLDADRVRGISSDKVVIDEVQDMDPAHLPIIWETMSYSPWRLRQLTGTPKTLENPLEGLWQRSSQAEWLMICAHCKTDNLPCKDLHAEDMLGPWREDISEQAPGLVCRKCRRPINPRHGRWLHKYPERAIENPGYHVPQCIMPLHYSSPKHWGELLAKREGWGNTTEQTFWNEVMGESMDTGIKLVSQTDLERAGVLPWENNPERPSPQIRERLKNYRFRALGVDWGGGGEDGVSFTTIALMGITAGGKIDVLWGKRLLRFEHAAEAVEIRFWMNLFNATLIAHDYTGAGTVRETVLIQAGLPMSRIMPIQYVRTASKGLVNFVKATQLHPRDHYRIDKARSILYTCQAIKLGMIRTFKYDFKNEDDRGLLSDFLALVENKVESRMAGDIYTITKNPILTDDFAHSVTLGAMALWHATGTFPNFGALAATTKITDEQILAAGNKSYGWAEDPNPESRK